jgi:hypothetical protein
MLLLPGFAMDDKFGGQINIFWNIFWLASELGVYFNL